MSASRVRVFLVCLGLMAMPLVPSWIAGGREGTDAAVSVFSMMLFVGAVLIGWQLIQREIRKAEDRDEQ